MIGGPRFAHLRVRIADRHGDPFRFLGHLESALRTAGVPEATIRSIATEATAKDYVHTLRTVIKTVEIE